MIKATVRLTVEKKVIALTNTGVCLACRGIGMKTQLPPMVD